MAAKRVKDEAEAALRRRQHARMEVCVTESQRLLSHTWSPFSFALESVPAGIQYPIVVLYSQDRWCSCKPPSPAPTLTAESSQGLAALQPKMQAWLGRLGGWADALALGPVAADLQSQAISKRWDAKDMIGLKVSFPGMERADPVLWLDNLLPMVRLCCRHVTGTVSTKGARGTSH